MSDNTAIWFVRKVVSYLIQLIVITTSCIVCVEYSKTGQLDSYDYHATNVAIATLVIYTALNGLVLIDYLHRCTNNIVFNEEERKPMLYARLFYVPIITCGMFTIFAAAFGIYAITHDLITSSERSENNRIIALSITLSALIIWSMLVIHLIAECLNKYCGRCCDFIKNKPPNNPLYADSMA
jgi:hypothetical protein